MTDASSDLEDGPVHERQAEGREMPEARGSLLLGSPGVEAVDVAAARHALLGNAPPLDNVGHPAEFRENRLRASDANRRWMSA